MNVYPTAGGSQMVKKTKQNTTKKPLKGLANYLPCHMIPAKESCPITSSAHL